MIIGRLSSVVLRSDGAAARYWYYIGHMEILEWTRGVVLDCSHSSGKTVAEFPEKSFELLPGDSDIDNTVPESLQRKNKSCCVV
jgi:hypothetical protein